MTEKDTKQRDRRILLALLLCMTVITAYRIMMIALYLSKYIDDDQALMWYGTVLASHGGILEPHFLGQPYGSMLESILAVPLYVSGVPLEWALPLATFFIWFFPYVLTSLLCRKKMPLISFLILLSALLFRWKYDILTNIPRSFISGFPFAFMGVALVTSERNPKRWKLFAGILLMGLGYLNTVTTIAVSAFGILYLVLYDKQRLKRDWWVLLSGAAVVILLLLYCNNWFYKLHPDYWVFGVAEKITLSRGALIKNIKNLPAILTSFSLYNFKNVPVFFILYCIAAIIWVVHLFKKKDRSFLTVILCAVLGSGSFFVIRRSSYYDSSLVYSHTRIFLYLPYVLITVLYLYSRKSEQAQISDDIIAALGSMKLKCKYACTLLVLLVVACSAVKAYHFGTNVIYRDEIYEGTERIGMCSVEDLYRLADELAELAETNGSDIIVSINHVVKDGTIKPAHRNKCIDYATSALNYGKYTEYRTYFDRRTDVYLKLKERTLHNEAVTFVRFDKNEIAESYTEIVDGTDCVSYVEEKTGLIRSEIKVKAS